MQRLAIMVALITALAGCGDDGGTPPTSAPPSGPITGEANVLEALRAGCEAGDFFECDVLYQASPFDSALEAFADTCGGRDIPEGGYCADSHGLAVDLGDLRNECEAGDMFSCDLLYLYSPFDSTEEAIGASCGGIGRDSRTCVVDHGLER